MGNREVSRWAGGKYQNLLNRLDAGFPINRPAPPVFYFLICFALTKLSRYPGGFAHLPAGTPVRRVLPSTFPSPVASIFLASSSNDRHDSAAPFPAPQTSAFQISVFQLFR